MKLIIRRKQRVAEQKVVSQRGVVDEILIPGQECRVVVTGGIYWHALIPPGIVNLSPGAVIQLSRRPQENKLQILSI